jgi:hypothetical protein
MYCVVDARSRAYPAHKRSGTVERELEEPGELWCSLIPNSSIAAARKLIPAEVGLEELFLK